MPYQFRQTGAEIQDILDQVGENTGDISSINTTLTQLTESSLTRVANNITGGAANDGIALWKSLGSCYCIFSQLGMLNGQPTTWGILVSILVGNEVFQMFHTQPYGDLYFRGGHNTDTAMPSAWRRVVRDDEITQMAQSVYTGWASSFSFPCSRGGILLINGGSTAFGFWWPGGTFTPVSIKGDAASAYTWSYSNGTATVTASGNRAWTFVGG